MEPDRPVVVELTREETKSVLTLVNRYILKLEDRPGLTHGELAARTRGSRELAGKLQAALSPYRLRGDK